MRYLRKGAALVGTLALAYGVTSLPAHAQKRGGTLTFVVGSPIPSFDAHVESTFGVIHPLMPFYSLLVRANPDNPASTTDMVCDLCDGKVPEPTDGGKTYTFKIRQGVKFHDGTPLTSHDVVASFEKIAKPPKGVRSTRKQYFVMVKSVEAPDDHTVVFKLAYPTATFIPSVAMPFNFIYSKKNLTEKGYEWHQKNINGTGPFKFTEYQPGAFVSGVRNENYFEKDRPYLDGFKAIIAPSLSARILALESDRASIEFRGFTPKSRDDLKRVLGDKLTVQEGDWNCSLYLTFNHKRKPFDDARVRRALNLGLDRWGGSKYLSRVAIVKTVGGIVFPSHPLAATFEELTRMEGFSQDIKKSRELARKLLKEAGHEKLEFVLTNREVDQPYKMIGTWAIDQWRQIGVKVKQDVVTTASWFERQQKTKEFDVTTDANCQSVVNPIADASKWLGSAGSNYGSYQDAKLEAIYDKMLKSGDAIEQRKLMRAFEQHAISDEAHMLTTLWWWRISMHRSYVKGWKSSPSHYVNQALDNVWLDQ